MFVLMEIKRVYKLGDIAKMLISSYVAMQLVLIQNSYWLTGVHTVWRVNFEE